MIRKLKGLSEISVQRMMYLLMYLFGISMSSLGFNVLNKPFVYLLPLIPLSITIFAIEWNYHSWKKSLEKLEVTKREYQESVEKFVAKSLGIDIGDVEMIHKGEFGAKVRAGDEMYEVIVTDCTFLICNGEILNK